MRFRRNFRATGSLRNVLMSIFQKIFPSPKMEAILNFRIFAKNLKTQICFYLLNRARYSDFVELFDPINAKRHEAEIIYMYTNKVSWGGHYT